MREDTLSRSGTSVNQKVVPARGRILVKRTDEVKACPKKLLDIFPGRDFISGKMIGVVIRAEGIEVLPVQDGLEVGLVLEKIANFVNKTVTLVMADIAGIPAIRAVVHRIQPVGRVAVADKQVPLFGG